MQNRKLFAPALFAALISTNIAFGQNVDYDAAARHADRAIQAYKDMKADQAIDIANEALAAAMVHLHICKPMHDQTALTRREYIASVVKGRGRQKAVAEECAQEEIAYANICKPREGMRSDFSTFTVVEPSCPTRWAEWPPVPFPFSPEYYRRLAEVRALYR